MTLFSIIAGILMSTLRVSTPLIFAAMGGLLSERSGVINIALEGLILVGAFTAAAVTDGTQSPYLGFLAGGAAGAVLAGVYAVFVIRFRANQIVAGTAINLLAAGVTPFLTKIFYDSTGATRSLPIELRLTFEPLVIAFASVGLIAFWLSRMSSGLWLRFAGENPHALESQGVSVRSVRFFSVMAGGVLAGWGGAALSIWLASGFSRNMSAGRGFIALAALIFGKWRPIPTLAACLFFGLTEALQIRLQGVILWGTDPVPVQFIQILPYVVTMVVLAGWVGQSRAPKALGLPF